MTKGYIKHTTVVPLGLLTTVLLSGLVLSSSIVSADNDSVVDEINITVPVSCTMAGTGMESHNAEINNGQYNSNIGETTMKAFCNDNNGFAIYAIGYTDNEDGKNVLTNSTLGSTHDIVTGTALSGDTSNWAMKLSTITSPTPTYPIIIAGSTDDTDKEQGDLDYSAFQAVPADYALVAKRTAGTDIGTTAEGATLKSTYQAYISKTQPAGIYTGQVKYTLVHPHNAAAPTPTPPATPGNITYNANANDVIGTMGNQPITDGDTVTLYASNFSRTGYGFAGWSNVPDYTTDSNAHFYGPQSDFVVPEGTTASGLNLYAVWIESVGSLQDTETVASLCGTNGSGGSLVADPADGTANLSSVAALTDQRDNQTYAIAKLADGNCWMIENLRLDSQYSTGEANIALSQGYDSSFVGLADSETGTFDYEGSTIANSIYSIDSSTEITISGSNQAFRIPRYNNSNTYNRANSTTNLDENTYSYGNYYNFIAATADTTFYGNYDTVVRTTSICPNGWGIPSRSEYGALTQSLAGNAFENWRKYPINLLVSGAIWGNASYYRGQRGFYWEKQGDGVDEAKGLSISSTGSSYTSFNSRNSGASVRCRITN